MWESIEEHASMATERLLVPGGWLYRTKIVGVSVSMCFVPDGSVNIEASQMLNEIVDNQRVSEHSQLS